MRAREANSRLNLGAVDLRLRAVITFRDDQGRDLTRWNRIGAMFPNSKGGLPDRARPHPRDPSVDIVAMPPREHEEG